MIVLLIWWVVWEGSVATAAAPFADMASCRAAELEIRAKNGIGSPVVIRTLCVETSHGS